MTTQVSVYERNAHGRCDGCGRVADRSWWRIKDLPNGRTVQAAFCDQCSGPLMKAMGHRPRAGIKAVPVSELKPVTVLKRQKTPTQARRLEQGSMGVQFSDEG